MQNLYLCHHGVKGMKWGVRHDPVSTGRSLAERARSSYAKMHSNVGKNLSVANRVSSKRPASEGTLTAVAGKLQFAKTDNIPLAQSPGFNDQRIMAYYTDRIGYLAKENGRIFAKLQRSMATNLYSPEQKIAVGQQLIGQMANNTMTMAFGTLAGQAAVLAGAALVTAAIKAKQRHDANKPAAQLEAAKNSFFTNGSSRSKNTFTVDDYNRHVDSLASKTSSPEQKRQPIRRSLN